MRDIDAWVLRCVTWLVGAAEETSKQVRRSEDYQSPLPLALRRTHLAPPSSLLSRRCNGVSEGLDHMHVFLYSTVIARVKRNDHFNNSSALHRSVPGFDIYHLIIGERVPLQPKLLSTMLSSNTSSFQPLQVSIQSSNTIVTFPEQMKSKIV